MTSSHHAFVAAVLSVLLAGAPVAAAEAAAAAVETYENARAVSGEHTAEP